MHRENIPIVSTHDLAISMTTRKEQNYIPKQKCEAGIVSSLSLIHTNMWHSSCAVFFKALEIWFCPNIVIFSNISY